MHFKNPVEKKPLAEQLLSCNDCNDTHTQKEMVIRLWHLSHSACHSSLGNYQRQQAHPMCCRERVGIVVRTRGEKGVGGVWKEGLEDSFFLPHCYRSKSLNLLTLWADRKLSHLTSCFLFTKIAVLFKLLSQCVPLFVCVKQSHPSSIDLWEFSSGYGLICAAGFSQPWCTKILGYLW